MVILMRSVVVFKVMVMLIMMVVAVHGDVDDVDGSVDGDVVDGVDGRCSLRC